MGHWQTRQSSRVRRDCSPLAELRCYSDRQSQALHIGPTITGLTLFSSGDLECQPLFLRVVRKVDAELILKLAPDKPGSAASQNS